MPVPIPTPIDACLRRLRVTVVDALVLTHFHADHVDGVPGVLRGRAVRQVLTSPVPEPDYQVREVTRWARAAAVPVQPLYAGDTLAWGPITARVLWPARVIREGSVPNNASVVLDVDAPGMRLLLLGDVEPASGTPGAAGPASRPGLRARSPVRRAEGGPPRVAPAGPAARRGGACRVSR